MRTLILAGLLALSGPSVVLPPSHPAANFERPVARAAERLDTAIFAGGCFWGVEAVFEHVKGVKDAISGYAGGKLATPSYEQVSDGDTGHAESVMVIYDPAAVSYETLMRVFFSVAHDATELNRQGPDVGTQYRSAIFYRNDAQKNAANAYIAQLTKAKYYPKPIVTEVSKLDRFYPAEDYHQDFMKKNPRNAYIVYWDAPKLERLKQGLPDLYVDRK
jgi:peptide-methionine (S)-S-oxide reductase